MTEPGIFTISIDVELAWGTCDRPLDTRLRAALEREREIVDRLLASFARHEVRATWAIVGHLLLREAPWHEGKAHPDFPRPILHNEIRDWFYQLPPSANDPAWCGRDLVEGIRNAEPSQEIGSHSFCHIPYDENRTFETAIEADIAAARSLHDAEGLPFEAFVFPRNCVGYRRALARAGICVYRGHRPRWYDRLPSARPRRLLRFLSYLLGVPPKPVTAMLDETGMVNVPDSMLLVSRRGLRRLIAPRRLLRMAKAGLDQAVHDSTIFHLWFHPSNFAYRTDEQFRLLEAILQYAEQLREERRLEVMTLGDVQRSLLETS